MLTTVLTCLLAAAAPATRPAGMADVAEAIRGADAAGALLNVGQFDPLAVPEMPLAIDDADGPALILSDKPEYFRTGDGVALREELDPGDYRLYLYHVPTPGSTDKRIVAAVENTGDEPAKITFARAVVPPAGGDYHAIGKAGLLGLFADAPAEPPLPGVTVAPGEVELLDAQLAEMPLKENDLLHGIYELSTDAPVKLRVLQMSPGADLAQAARTLPELPRVLPGHHPSGAGRGVFETSARTLRPAEPFDTADGPAQLVFADGEAEEWVAGRDSIAGERGENKGNYGVVYRVTIPYDSTDGRGVALLTYNARAGGQWCDFQANALRVLTPGELEAATDGVVPVPAGQTRYGGPPEMVLIQTFPPAKNGGEIELLFSPPGASCLPAPLVLVPVGQAGQGG